MNPAIIVALIELVDKLVPLLAQIRPTLAQAAGETQEQTAARLAAAADIFAKWAQPIVPPAPPVGER